ncbi:MAG: D-alanyl-D-alanine carboxypeptidase/D-alanyl-D-alanine-endopeptidase [Bryobacteraceae bacterium]
MRRALLVLLLAVPITAAGPAARIQAFLNASPLTRDAFWGIRIVDLDHNRVVFEHNPTRLFVPASNAKLFSTALALMRLGPDYRFSTRVLSDEQPRENGCVHSVTLIGGGDPNLSGRALPYRRDAPDGNPLQVIEDLAGQIAARGVPCVDGDITGDDTLYDWDPYPEGWAGDDAIWDYGAAVGALTINDGILSLSISPAETEGGLASIRVSPPLPYYQIDNRVRTLRAAERKVMVERLPGSHQVLVWGTMPPDDPGDTEVLGIDDPALYAAFALRDALTQRGIAVHGEARALHRLPGDGPYLPPAGFELARRESAPLVQDLQVTDKVSQNLHAEMGLLAVARARRRTGNREAGIAELQGFLGEAGLDKGSYHFVDGSGLSRLDLVSAEAVVRLLTYLYRSQFREPWISLLPVAGQDGTLHGRMTRPPAAGRIFAKTGSMSHVSALSGYARRRDGAMLVFSILVNNYNGHASAITEAIDRICTLMVE